jgi:hypothetical protein
MERPVRGNEPEKEDAGVSDDAQKRAIRILSTGISFLVMNRLAERFIDLPEEPGVWDDIKEELLKAGFTLGSTALASFIVRRVVAGR